MRVWELNLLWYLTSNCSRAAFMFLDWVRCPHFFTWLYLAPNIFLSVKYKKLSNLKLPNCPKSQILFHKKIPQQDFFWRTLTLCYFFIIIINNGLTLLTNSWGKLRQRSPMCDLLAKLSFFSEKDNFFHL